MALADGGVLANGIRRTFPPLPRWQAEVIGSAEMFQR